MPCRRRSARPSPSAGRPPRPRRSPERASAKYPWEMGERVSAVMCSEDEFAALAERELDALPGWIQAAIATYNVAISIEDVLPDQPRTLGVFARYSGASQITLYRLPIIR